MTNIPTAAGVTYIICYAEETAGVSTSTKFQQQVPPPEAAAACPAQSSSRTPRLRSARWSPRTSDQFDPTVAHCSSAALAVRSFTA